MAAIGGFPGQDHSHELDVYLKQMAARKQGFIGQLLAGAADDVRGDLSFADIKAVAVRAQVCRALRSEMNCWMDDLALATQHIAEGLVDGTLPEEIITSYPVEGYPEAASRAIARQVGLPFSDEPDQYPPGGGWLLNVDTEAVGGGIEALRAIQVADVGVAETADGGVWQFYPENLARQGVTLDQVRAVMHGLSLLDAARLLVDANNSRN